MFQPSVCFSGPRQMFNCRALALLVMALLPAPACASDIDPATVNSAGFAELTPDHQIHPEIVKAQILSDRADISPGEINGKHSGNFDEMLGAFAEAHGLPADIAWSPELWSKLAASFAGSVLTEYVISKEDTKGPFIQLAPKMEDMKGLKIWATPVCARPWLRSFT
jgi:hypothetical protein